jgi:outer membrane protein OmpA-like peptidoglycan-associated protein
MKWLRVGLAIPTLQATINSDESTLFAGPLGASGATVGIGDMGLEVGVYPLRQQDGAPLSLAVIPRFVFPTGSRGLFVGSGAFGVGLDVSLGREWTHFRFAATAGYQFQSASASVGGIYADDEVRWGLGLGLPFAEGQWEVQAEYAAAAVVTRAAREAFGTEGFGTSHMPMEVLLAARYAPEQAPLWAKLGIGRGLTSGWGTPDVRVFAQVGFAFVKAEPPPPPPEPVVRDTDEDGILDEYDNCPELAEDLNGYRDDDGCPDADADNDRVVDVLDQCPDEREDIDLFEDDDGCPEPDNDMDGLLDGDDECPKDPETLNGIDDQDGCPDGSLAFLDPERREITLLASITFQEGRATLMPESGGVLGAVVTTLLAFDDLEQVEILVWVASQGDPAAERKLARARAETIRQWMIDQGVDADRLTAKGQAEKSSTDRVVITVP